MEKTWLLIVNLIISVLVLYFTIFTIAYLILKRNVFPYSNISPLWGVVTLTSKFIFFKYDLINSFRHFI
jgi:hypothetical protein